MSHDIIMPALGMAQETGLIVAWHKKPGDAVASDDILMEVETDKSTMEVPAGVDGFLLSILFDAGTDVPVGDVIARVGAEFTEADAAAASEVKQEEVPAEPEPSEVAAQPEPEPVQSTVPVQEKTTSLFRSKKVSSEAPIKGPILASPKVKRLAAEEGLDLTLLMRAGLPQPYHVADLPQLRELSAQGLATASVASLEVAVEGAGMAQLQVLAGSDELQLSSEAIWAAFAASSYGRLSAPDSVHVKVVTPAQGREAHYADPHRTGISGIALVDEMTDLDIIVVDLTGDRVFALRPASAVVPTISVSGQPGAYRLVLTYSEDELGTDTAYALLDAFASRLDQPLIHIL